MTIEKMREEYRRIRERSQAASPEAFDAKVKEMLARKLNPTPGEWLEAAKGARFMCKRCAGTGRFVTGTLNGQPTGPGGICFRCSGHGSQNDADARRNFGADNHAIVQGFRQMMGPRRDETAEEREQRQEQDADDQAAAAYEERTHGRR